MRPCQPIRMNSTSPLEFSPQTSMTVFHGQPPRRAAVVDRRRGRPCDADGFEFGDVLVARDRIAAGPAGDHGLVDRERERRRRALVFDGEGQVKHG